MEILCPYCSNAVEYDNVCSLCHSDIKWVKRIYQQSDLCYTKGYYYAKDKDLSKAIDYLKKAVFFSKYNIQARNLLGLVYFQKGEMGEAIKQWIISISLQKNDNIAQKYLNKIQRTLNHFEEHKDAISLYNRALVYIKQKNNDMAVIRLKKAVSLNPRFIDARCLLALCYIEQKEYYRASKELSSILEIDKYNEKALVYLNAISEEDTKTKKPYDIATANIINKSYDTSTKPHRIINRGYSLRNYVMYFALGAVCMLVIQYALIYPNVTKKLQQDIKQYQYKQVELTNSIDKINRETAEQIKSLKEENGKLKMETESLQEGSNKLIQKEKFSDAKELSNSGKWTEAAEVIYNISPAMLDDAQKEEYESLKKQVYSKAAEALYYEGNRYYNNEDYVNARLSFEKTLLYMSEPYISRKTLYYMGSIEEKEGNIEKAKHYYNLLITDFDGTNEARLAQNSLSKF